MLLVIQMDMFFLYAKNFNMLLVIQMAMFFICEEP